jgi:hypothetical protein
VPPVWRATRPLAQVRCHREALPQIPPAPLPLERRREGTPHHWPAEAPHPQALQRLQSGTPAPRPARVRLRRPQARLKREPVPARTRRPGEGECGNALRLPGRSWRLLHNQRLRRACTPSPRHPAGAMERDRRRDELLLPALVQRRHKHPHHRSLLMLRPLPARREAGSGSVTRSHARHPDQMWSQPSRQPV